MKELLLYMAKSLVDDPDSVAVVEKTEEDGKVNQWAHWCGNPRIFRFLG